MAISGAPQACTFARIFALTWFLFCSGAHAEPGAALPCSGLEKGPTRTVSRILDGETLLFDDGSQLRLVGALAPLATDGGAKAGAWPSEVATRGELEALALGRTVEIHHGGERLDRYGRHLGHAFVVDEGGGDRRWLQGHLLSQGLARAYTTAHNHACGEVLLAAERQAREAGRGVWSVDAYRVREADAARELLRLRGTFQVIEGRVVHAQRTRGTFRLEFGAPAQRGLSVVLPRARGPKSAGLDGARVRVRGWVEERSGRPTIDLYIAGDLEIVEAGESQAPNAR